DSRSADTDFLVGNLLEGEVAEALDAYDFHRRFVVGSNGKCWTCGLNDRCGKGCPAAVVADGRYIGAVDREQCPVPDDVPLLRTGRRPACAAGSSPSRGRRASARTPSPPSSPSRWQPVRP